MTGRAAVDPAKTFKPLVDNNELAPLQQPMRLVDAQLVIKFAWRNTVVAAKVPLG